MWGEQSKRRAGSAQEPVHGRRWAPGCAGWNAAHERPSSNYSLQPAAPSESWRALRAPADSDLEQRPSPCVLALDAPPRGEGVRRLGSRGSASCTVHSASPGGIRTTQSSHGAAGFVCQASPLGAPGLRATKERPTLRDPGPPEGTHHKAGDTRASAAGRLGFQSARFLFVCFYGDVG